MLRNRGPALALAALLVLAVYGVSVSSRQPPYHEITGHCDQSACQKIRPEPPEDRIADYTEILALFTAVLAVVSFVQGIFLWRADKSTQKTLVLTQRPKLRVRNIVARHPSNGDPAPQLFTEGRPLQCQFFVTNIGGTGAAIVEAFAQIFQSPSGLPMRSPYEGINGNLRVPRETFAAGKSRDFSFISNEVLDDHAAKTIGSRVVGRQRLFVMGWITYRDGIGVVRRTAFCREFQHPGPWDDGRFYPVDDPDYEYEE